MINNDEWLVVVDRQEAFAHNEWSRWACSDGAYYQTDKNYTRLAKAYGYRVALHQIHCAVAAKRRMGGIHERVAGIPGPLRQSHV